MKIAFINDSIHHYATGAPSAVGGAERQQWLLARALASSGWSVVIGVSDAVKLDSRTVIDNVEFVGIGRVRSHVAAAWCRFLMRERPDWWYWRCATHLLGPAFAVARYLGVRTVFAAALDRDVKPRGALSVPRQRWWPLYAWGLSLADRILVQHAGQLGAIPSWLRSKTYLVPSIAGEGLETRPHLERARHIAWVGQLKHPKRPDLLIQIASQAKTLRFTVCGGPSRFMSDKDYSHKVMDRFRSMPNIDYRGQVTPDEALQTIASAAVLLSTAEEEGFPNTFLQAWASGSPVVSIKIDPDHVIERRKLGATCDDVHSAIAAMRSLIDSPHERQTIACRARRYIDEHHSESAVVASFNRAIDGKSSGVERVLSDESQTGLVP